MLENDQAGGSAVGSKDAPLPVMPHASGWFVHFHTSLLLGLLAVVLVALVHWLPGIAALDHFGQDLAERVYADGSHAAPAGVTPVVLLALDFSGKDSKRSEVGDITEAITLLTQLEPMAVVIDQEIANTVASDKMADFLAAIRKAAQKTQVVVLPTMLPSADGKSAIAQPSRLNELRDLKAVRFAVPFLLPDPDGIIRSTPVSVCVAWPNGRPEPLPTLGTSIHEATATDCAKPELLEILYSVSEPAFQEWSPLLPRISLDALRRLGRDAADQVKGRVVLAGEVGSGAWSDLHLTPVGMMSGVLVHANILLTPPDRVVETEAAWWNAGLLALTATAAAAACFAIQYAFQSRLSRLVWRWWWRALVGLPLFVAFALLAVVVAWGAVLAAGAVISGHSDRSEAAKLAMEVGSVVFTAVLFAGYFAAVDGLRPKQRACAVLAAWLRPAAFVLTGGICVWCIGGIWVYCGSEMLPAGLKVGSLAPAFAAGLEAFIKAGGVIAVLERGVERVMAWISAVGILLMIQVAWAANEPAQPGGLLVISAGNARVERETTSTKLAPNQQMEVVARDVVVLEGGATAQIRRGTGAGPIPLVGPNVYQVLPLPQERMTVGLDRSFSAFWQLMFSASRPPGPQIGATVRMRGTDDSESLRWTTLLPVDAAELPPGPGGLALCWAGGRSPYTITVEGERSGQGFGSWTSDDSFLWAPGFTMPDEPVEVMVRDFNGTFVSADMSPATYPLPRVVSAAEAAEAPATAAMALFVESEPKWRLEALRRLAALAPANPQAASALAEMQRAARAASPP